MWFSHTSILHPNAQNIKFSSQIIWIFENHSPQQNNGCQWWPFTDNFEPCYTCNVMRMTNCQMNWVRNKIWTLCEILVNPFSLNLNLVNAFSTSCLLSSSVWHLFLVCFTQITLFYQRKIQRLMKKQMSLEMTVMALLLGEIYFYSRNVFNLLALAILLKYTQRSCGSACENHTLSSLN